MRKRKPDFSAVVVVLIVTLCGSRALGQDTAPASEQQPPAAAGLAAVSADDPGKANVEGREDPPRQSPFQEETVGPLPRDAAYDAAKPAPLPAADGACSALAKPARASSCSTDDLWTAAPCGRRCDGACRHGLPLDGLFALRDRRDEFFHPFTVGGWLDQGVTVNGSLPDDRFNGPVGFNDRDDEYQLNQLDTFIEKRADTGGHGVDVGGRIDFLYGTDWRFIRSSGLEDKWNERRFYGAALPQAYADFAVNDCTVRIGHYYSPAAYEAVPAPENFFYSHSYVRLYGEPFTLTGLMGSYVVTDQWKLSAGFDRGWNQWEDNDDDLDLLGGVYWTSCDGSTSVALTVLTGPYDDAGQLNRTMYSLSLSHYFSPRLQYVIEHNYGLDDGGGLLHRDGTIEDAQWYGIAHYLLYTVNRCWSLGMRVEWFVDDDGTRVGGMGAPHGWTLGPNLGPNSNANRIGWAGGFSEVTCGINWRPCRDVVVRPEARWDWYGGPADGLGRLPFDFGNKSNQFTFATDLIVKF